MVFVLIVVFKIKIFWVLMYNVELYKNICFIGFSSMQIIVLEDTKEYISYVSKEEAKTQDRRPADLLVCLDVEMRSTSYCIPVIT